MTAESWVVNVYQKTYLQGIPASCMGGSEVTGGAGHVWQWSDIWPKHQHPQGVPAIMAAI